MDPQPGSTEERTGSPFPVSGGEAQAASQVMLTAWNLLHPTRLAFEGVAWLALLTAALAAVYSWRDKAPAWGLILGFSLLWALGALAAYALHRSFNRSART